MAKNDLYMVWLLPVAVGILLSMMIPAIKHVTPPKRMKRVFFALASLIILVTTLFVAIAYSFASAYCVGGSLASLGAVLTLTWPFFVFWILAPSLPSPKTYWQKRLQVWFKWAIAFCFTCVWLAVTFIGLGFGGHEPIMDD